MAKKIYPGGFRLTKKMAEALAVQELGTSRGLEKEANMPDGYYVMRFGNLEVLIKPDTYTNSGRILLAVWMNGVPDGIVQFYDRETLVLDDDMVKKYIRKEEREVLEQWVYDTGPEECHKLIDEIWNKR